MKLFICVVVLLFLAGSLNVLNCTAAERVYVGIHDRGNGSDRVMTYDLRGKLISSFSIVGGLVDLAPGDQGEIYVLTHQERPNGNGDLQGFSVIDKYSTDGTWISEIVSLGSGSLLGPVVGPDGNVYFSFNDRSPAVRGYSTIERYSPDGDPLGVFATTGTLSNYAHWGIDFDSSGRMYVGTDRFIESFDGNGNSLGKWLHPSFSKALDLDIDRNDAIRLTINTYSDPKIFSFNTAGELLPPIKPGIFSVSITSDSSGVVYVGGQERDGTNSIKTFRNDGTLIGYFASGIAHQILSVKVATVVPEPSSTTLASCIIALTACHSVRRKQR